MAVYNQQDRQNRNLPPSGRLWRLAPLAFGIVFPFVLFALLAEDVYTHEGIGWDLPMQTVVHSYASPLLDRFFKAITTAGFGGVIIADTLVALIFAYRRRWNTFTFWVASVGGAEVLNLFLKEVFHRVRPDLWASSVHATGYSFPSGHAMASMALVGSALFLVPLRWRLGAALLGGLFVFLVGLSRVYLGVHFPSDVLAGWAASLIWVSGVGDLLRNEGVARWRRARAATRSGGAGSTNR